LQKRNINVFIIAQHRTGSTLLKNILGAHSKVHFAFDEMNLFEPFRKDTLDRIINHKSITPVHLGELIKKQQIYGTFWQEFEKSGIKIDELVHRLNQNVPFSITSVLDAVIQLLKEKNKVDMVGIKYPVHFSRIDFLVSNYPDSTIFFLTRNPSAIIASKLNDPATRRRKKKSLVHKFLIHYVTILYFALEFNRSSILFHKNRERVKLVIYDQLVSQKQDVIKELCKCIGIDFEEQMLLVTGKPSSHTNTTVNSISDERVQQYTSILSRFDKKFIGILTNRQHKKLVNVSGIDF
jgi:hypothetical protein